MYEQYTDKQIVEMLRPKLTKIMDGMDGMLDTALEHSEGGRNLIKLIATIYRSAYIRGQLGRSFIIGELKRTEHWVPATRDNVKKGVKVRYLNAGKHLKNPEFYPLQGTIGEVVLVCDDDTCTVQWPGYKNTWYASRFDLEVWLCE
jgi:hypothetical protein